MEKKYLLEELYIFILVMKLEECKNVHYMENSVSYIENSINKSETKENLYRKLQIKKNTIGFIIHVSENSKNKDIYGYKYESSIDYGIIDWIRGYIYVNSIYIENTTQKYYKILE
ncbi:uncharacterized protein PMUG01_09012400 [Plasmodium malariae]|uniref:Uncharacterized protein n=1 Tax=Plasmodium malariae TaxID=5858 RepID=A0A1D3PBC7_PLAMA|nr:uncharacterized protein PMUG01_09012400 [Plasmodium malariae]SCN12557.1 hypothetical protein PMUG01_09012400 [Plasmodium malariae]